MRIIVHLIFFMLLSLDGNIALAGGRSFCFKNMIPFLTSYWTIPSTVKRKAKLINVPESALTREGFFLIHKGKKVVNSYSHRIVESNKLYLLGEGNSAKVYRLNIKNRSYIIKEYYGWAALQDAHLSDRNTLLYLSEFGDIFKTPNILKNSTKYTLMYDDIQGRSLEDLMLSLEIHPSLKLYLANRYKEKIERLIDVLAGVKGFSVNDYDDRAFGDYYLPYVAFSKGDMKIIMRPDQIVVDSKSLDMTIIDPY